VLGQEVVHGLGQDLLPRPLKSQGRAVGLQAKPVASIGQLRPLFGHLPLRQRFLLGINYLVQQRKELQRGDLRQQAVPPGHVADLYSPEAEES